MPLSGKRKEQQQKQISDNTKAKEKQDSQVSDSKQSMSDNRAGSSNQPQTHNSSGRPLTQQEIQWNEIKNENTSFAREQASKEQQTLSRGAGGGVRHSVQLNETLRVQDSVGAKVQKVERRTKQIKQHLQEQEAEKLELIKQRKIAQQELTDATNFRASPAGKTSFLNEYNKRSRAGKRRGSPTKVDIAVTNAQAKVKSLNSSISDKQNTIQFFEVEQTNLKQELSTGNAGSFATGDDSKKQSRRKPPPQVSQSIRGIGIAGNNYNKIKSFFGLQEPDFDGKRNSVELNESLSLNQGSPKKSNDVVERFTPRTVEYGTTRFDNSKFGNNRDYYSLKDTEQNNSQKTTLPSGQVIEVKKKQETNADRYISGLASVPQNLFTLGKEGVEAVASDVKKGKLETTKQSELKKDIIISPLGAITEHIGDPDYFSKTGKSLGDLGADMKKDPFYYAGNTVSNAVLIAGTLGIGKAPAIAKKLTPSKESKAKNIIDFMHPPKEITVNEFALTGKSIKSQSGLEVLEYKPTKIKKPELETFGIQSSKQGDNIKLAGTEATGQTKTQKVSQIESFEKVGDVHGYETYKATFKDQSGSFQSVEAIMTPNPILRYSGKAQKSADIFPTANKGIKLDVETGSKIKAEIEANPSKSKEIFDSYAMKGEGGKFFERPPSNDIVGLTDFTTKKGTSIGNIKKGSTETYDAMGARGTEIATQESFYFDDLFARVSTNKQYGNLLQSGKIKSPKTDIPKETPSLDSQYFAPDYLRGESSIAVAESTGLSKWAGFPKKGEPSKFEKVTPYEKQFFDESVGLDKPRDFKKMKGFDLEKPPTSKVADNENPFGLLTKEKQEGVLSELKGGGDFTKSTNTKQQPQGFAMAENYESDLISSQKSEIFEKPQKQDADLFTGVFSGFDSKQDSKLKLGLPAMQGLDQSNSFDLDVFKAPKESTKQDQSFGLAFDNGFATTPKKKQTAITDTVPVAPIIDITVVPEDPTTPPFKGGIGAPPPLFLLEDEAGFELLWGQKKNKGKKRFHNVDPRTVLGHFDGGSLGYQSTEYKQLTKGKKKGKGKKNDNYSFDNLWDDLGF